MYLLCVMDINWLIQESSGLKPELFNDIKLWSVKNLNTLSFKKNFFANR